MRDATHQDSSLPSGIDKAAYKEYCRVVEAIGSRWPLGTNEILREHNPVLLRELVSLEKQLDSLIVIESKPKELKKQFKDTLSKFSKTVENCIEYANRRIAIEGRERASIGE
jgi:hypothetical protein